MALTYSKRHSTGVYCILNQATGKRYIGSASKSLNNRIRSHKYCLSHRTHKNRHLQNSWDHYGAMQFQFSILERCSPKLCIVREQYWIDFYNSYDRQFGYNKSPTAGSPLGVVHSLETRHKVSAALKGKKKSPSHAGNIRAAKQNTSCITRNKMSTYAKHRTVRHLENLSESMRGNNNGAGTVFSESARRAISEKAKARWAKWRKSGYIKEVGRLIKVGQNQAKQERSNHG